MQFASPKPIVWLEWFWKVVFQNKIQTKPKIEILQAWFGQERIASWWMAKVRPRRHGLYKLEENQITKAGFKESSYSYGLEDTQTAKYNERFPPSNNF